MDDFCYNPEFHFFFSSFSTWHSNADFEKGLKTFSFAYRADVARSLRHGVRMPFDVWHVPCSVDSRYKISNFAPQVPGAKHIGTFDLAKKR